MTRKKLKAKEPIIIVFVGFVTLNIGVFLDFATELEQIHIEIVVILVFALLVLLADKITKDPKN